MAKWTKVLNLAELFSQVVGLNPAGFIYYHSDNFQLVAYQQTDKWQGPTFQLLQICLKCTSLIICLCSNISTTPITAMRCRQSLLLSVVQLKGKHCRKPHCRGCRYVWSMSGNECVIIFNTRIFRDFSRYISNMISAGDDVLQPEVLQMLAEIHKGVYAIEAQPNNKTWQDGICKT